MFFFLRSEEPTYFWRQGYIFSRALIKATEWLWRLLISSLRKHPFLLALHSWGRFGCFRRLIDKGYETKWIDLAGQTELEIDSISHLLVSKALSFKTRLCRNLSWENEFQSQENKKAFFINGFALCLALKQRLGETRNWPISFRSAISLELISARLAVPGFPRMILRKFSCFSLLQPQ